MALIVSGRRGVLDLHGTRLAVLAVWYFTWGTLPTRGTQRAVLYVRYSTCGTRCAVLNVRYAICSTRRAVLDARYSMCGTPRAVLYVRYSTCGTQRYHEPRHTPLLTPDKTRRHFRQVAVHFYDYNLRSLIRGSTFARGGVGRRLRLPST